MPIYEYECAKCGVFEVNQRITDDPLRKCPTCRAKVKKLISNTSFQLKGSGWYVTDYARKDGGAKESKASKETKESKESKSDSTSASDTSSKSGESGGKKGKSKATSAEAA
jgi:putative FmdB family regulatory protein